MVTIDARKLTDVLLKKRDELRAEYGLTEYQMMMESTEEEKLNLIKEIGRTQGSFEMLVWVANTLETMLETKEE